MNKIELENKIFWNQNDIYKLSLFYQLDDEYHKEEKLLKKAAKKYPNWDYLKQRLAWHSRPLFHRDPSKSKLVPRKPLHLPRNPKFTPKKNTLNNLCFVIGSSSNSPYFALSIELIESIKATQLYKNIPIKILDCGLSKNDQLFFKEKFNIEVKDPGWDIPEKLILKKSQPRIPEAGWKGIIARAFLHKYFPGYEFYMWLDADLWIQDERKLDHFIKLCETQKIGFSTEPPGYTYWPKNHFFNTVPKDFQNTIHNKRACTANIFCMHKSFCEEFAKNMKDCVKKKGALMFGTDLAVLNYTAYSWNKNLKIITESHYNYHYNIYPTVGKNNILKDPKNKQTIGIITFSGCAKYLPHFLPLAFGWKKSNLRACIHFLIMSICFIYYATKKNTIKKIILPNFIKKIIGCTTTSHRYRIWPWQNKSNIKKILNLRK